MKKTILANYGFWCDAKKQTKLIVLTMFLISVCFSRGYAAPNDTSQASPNIVIIFTDDQGYNDMGCFNSPNIKTPNIDKMADEGMRFTNFYATASICSASRASILTGCYPTRVGVTGVFWPKGGNLDTKKGLHQDEITMAELLKEKDYKTACLGKWHLGDYDQFLPPNQGFDLFYGIPYSNDMNNPGRGEPALPMMRNFEIVEQPVDNNLLTQKLTAEALRFVEENKDTSFFLYLAYPMPHDPPGASEDFLGKSDAGIYGDAIEEIDWGTGQIIQKLKDLGISENTFVVVTSDNGPWLANDKIGGSAYPLRGGKFSSLEGGQRMPCVMWWPGTIPAGEVCEEIATIMDFYVTFADVNNISLPDDRVIDGKNIYPLMTGVEGATSPYEYLLYYGRELTAQRIRYQNWKYTPGTPGELYDLSMDVSESNNVASSNPDVCTQLKAKLAELDQEVIENSRPVGVKIDVVESVDITNCPDTLALGESYYLEVSILPETNEGVSVTWSSSDENVATVSNGLVNALAEGSCYARVTTVTGGLQDSCQIIVGAHKFVQSYYPGDTISLVLADTLYSPDGTGIQVVTKNEVPNLGMTKKDNYFAFNDVTFDKAGDYKFILNGSSNSAVGVTMSTIDIYINFEKVGTANYTGSGNWSNYIDHEYVLTVPKVANNSHLKWLFRPVSGTWAGNFRTLYYDFIPGTEIDPTALGMAVAGMHNVYPNPAADCVIVELKGEQPANVTISNLIGQLIYAQYGVQNTVKISTDEIENGMYVVQIEQGNQITSHKILVK